MQLLYANVVMRWIILFILFWSSPAWAITVAISASRCTTAGEACATPLSVIFKTDISDANFIEWHCEWDFGDDDSVSGGAATWTNGVATGEFAKKNRAIGPIAAHVYEGIATHTVTVDCVDPSTGDQASNTESIITDDPDVQWATTTTICVRDAADGTFAGCPSGATEVTQSNYVTIFTDYALADRRVLLRRYYHVENT